MAPHPNLRLTVHPKQRLPSHNNLQIIDNKEHTITTQENVPGMMCGTCVFYHLETTLERDIHPLKHLPPYNPDPPEVVTILEGVCTRHQGYLFIGIKDNETCPYYEERNPMYQFHDTVLTDDADPHQGPVIHRVLT